MALSIDPRAAELMGRDMHLPAVPSEHLRRDALVQRFKAPPSWKPDVELERWPIPRQPTAAAVLVPIVMRGESPTVLLTQRTSHLAKHAGQISFPGGRSDPGDADAIFTALREAEEEVSLSPGRVDVLGILPTYTTGTGYIVTPVVGLIEPTREEGERLDLRAEPGEVEEIFEVPLHFLMDPRHHQRRAFDLPGTRIEFYAMPWTPDPAVGKEYFIWGATAAMLRNLYRFLVA